MLFEPYAHYLFTFLTLSPVGTDYLPRGRIIYLLFLLAPGWDAPRDGSGYLFIFLARSLVRSRLAPDSDYLFIFLTRVLAGACWSRNLIIYLFFLLAPSRARAGLVYDHLFIFVTRSLAGSCCSWHPIIYLFLLLGPLRARAGLMG